MASNTSYGAVVIDSSSEFDKDTCVGARISSIGVAVVAGKGVGVSVKVYGNDVVATSVVVVKKGFSYAQSLCRGGGLEKDTKPFVSLPILTCKPLSLNLGVESLFEIEECTRDLFKDSIIYHFKGFWPSLRAPCMDFEALGSIYYGYY